ncbi:hypothetical protein EZV62_001301 [Acer yangbiense]|uniref:Peptidyl-prolyl cis-trans isomerase n=1 Tax=Acer yangbiense TaxID=1000413 RepID=A0A5C7IW28_9ROSI|nr:hypothetical protein EZV62_001301 [Acer yangbiense]
MPNPRVFLDLNIGGQPVGRLVIELFSDSTPKTAENFRALCTGEKGIGKNRKALHYKGTTFHSVIPRSMFNGGDLTEGTNNSQFIICTDKTEWLDGINVVFGIVVEGFNVMKTVQKVGSISGLTSKPVTISDCGQL